MGGTGSGPAHATTPVGDDRPSRKVLPMSGIDDILRSLPMDQLARQLGTDEATARQATSMALPALLGGLQANATDPGGAASLQEALAQHDDDLYGERVDLERVDTRDGERISSHIFGSNEDQVVHALGGAGGAGLGGDLIKRLLPLLAPIVLSYLAKQMQGRGRSGGSAALACMPPRSAGRAIEAACRAVASSVPSWRASWSMGRERRMSSRPDMGDLSGRPVGADQRVRVGRTPCPSPPNLLRSRSIP